MSNIVTISKAKQYVQLEGQKDGTSFNPTNFVYYLPRTINQLTKMVGNDLVLKGLDTDISVVNNIATVKISPGTIIIDSTVIEINDTITATLDSLNTFDLEGKIVVFIQYQYLQTVAINAVKLGITYVDKNGHPFGTWDQNKNRLTLNFYDISYDTLSNLQLTEISNDNLLIDTKVYYKNGYSLDNMTLNKYLSYFLSGISSGTSNIGAGGTLPDEVIALGDFRILDELIVDGNLTIHGPITNIESETTFTKDVTVKDDFYVNGQRFLIDSTDTQFGSQILLLDRNNVGSGTENQYSGIKVNRGDQPAAILYFDEETDRWMCGIEGGNFFTIPSLDDLKNLTHDDITDWETAFTNSFNTLWSVKNTDNLSEGTINKYFTTDRVYETMVDKLDAGTNISIEQKNNKLRISYDNNPVIASYDNLGVIKVGQLLNVSSDGTLSANLQSQNNFSDALKNKLDNIQTNANNYIHPDTHPATMIVQDSTHRFVTDAQITKWDSGVYTPATGDTYGVIKVGSGLDINSTGHLYVSYLSPGVILQDSTHRFVTDSQIAAWESYQFTLTPATSTALGGIKVGAGLNITSDGILSIGTHNHDDLYYTKTELLSTNGHNDKIDWSQIKNIPNYGSGKWLNPVATKAELLALDTSSLTGGECILVEDDGDGYAAQYCFNTLVNNTWVKIADVNFISYTHPTVPSIAMDMTGNLVLSKLTTNATGHVVSVEARRLTLEDLGYTTGDTYPEILKFEVEPSVALLGTTLTEVILTWETNKNISKQTLSHNIGELDPQVRSYLHNTSCSVNRTYNLVIEDIKTIEADIELKFKNYRYWGPAPMPSVVDEAFVEGLNFRELEDSQKITFTVSCTEYDYVWFAYPARSDRATFYSGFTQGGFNTLYLVNITNSAGYTEPYYVYRSDYSNLGTITVTTDVKIVYVGGSGNTDYVLPPATDNILGGIKTGPEFDITSDGILSLANNAPDITSFNMSPMFAVMGQHLDTLIFSWTTSGNIIRKKIDNGIGEINVSATNYVKTGLDINNDTSFTFSVYSNVSKDSVVKLLQFRNYLYWGIGVDKSCLTNKRLITTNFYGDTLTVTGITQYLYISYPKRYGEVDFMVNGFLSGFGSLELVSKTNEFDFTELYYVYKSSKSNLSDITIQILSRV